VAQVVQYLLWKCKALSSNPSLTKKKKRKEKRDGKHHYPLFFPSVLAITARTLMDISFLWHLLGLTD
jgi:hypothetical protein